MIGSTVQLRYSVLDEAEMVEILDHYNAVKGGLIPFALPTITWSGNENANEFTIAGDAWRYQQPPDVEEIFCGGYVVQVALESVPGEGAGLLGADLIVNIALATGAVAAANGAQLTVAVSIEIGSGKAAGIAETVTASMSTVGTATGGVSVSVIGVIADILVSLNAGFAFAGLSRVFNVFTSLVAGTGFSNNDPDFNSVEMLLHGWNGFVDSSLNNRGLNVNAGVTLITTGPRFGAELISLPSGNNNYHIRWTNVTLVRPWTIEAWVWMDAFNFSNFICSVNPFGNSALDDYFAVNPDRYLEIRVGNALFDSDFLRSAAPVIQASTWHHVAATVDETTLRLFVDGTEVASKSRPLNLDYSFTLGQIGPRTRRLQEFRATGACRYTSSFTRPKESFPSLAGVTHAAIDGATKTVTVTPTPGAASSP
jgi:hypothetical protein